MNENIKAPRHWLLWLVPGEIPAQKASNAENVSIWWRHHVMLFFMVYNQSEGKCFDSYYPLPCWIHFRKYTGIFVFLLVLDTAITHSGDQSISSYGLDRYDDVIKWKHFPRHWPFVRGIHRWPVNSSLKGHARTPLRFSLICARINGWINNREAGDLKRHRAHYDVSVMICRRIYRFQHQKLYRFDAKCFPNHNFAGHILYPVSIQRSSW